MEWYKQGFIITTDKTRVDISYIHNFLSNTYWAQNIPREVVEHAVAGSLCFSILHDGRQVGFARVITDEATFAYLADVFVDPAYRGKGLSKWLMDTIMNYPSLQGLRRFMLATRDAHGLYSRYGFEPITHVDRWMQIHRPDVYFKS